MRAKRTACSQRNCALRQNQSAYLWMFKEIEAATQDNTEWLGIRRRPSALGGLALSRCRLFLHGQIGSTRRRIQSLQTRI